MMALRAACDAKCSVVTALWKACSRVWSSMAPSNHDEVTGKLNIMPALVVLGDVAVRHPQARVGDVEQDLDGLAGAHEDGVLPDEVVSDYAVSGKYRRIGRLRGCGTGGASGGPGPCRSSRRILTRSPTRKAQSIWPFSLPVSRSTSFQVMLHESEARLISGIRSSHSRPSGASWLWLCPCLAVLGGRPAGASRGRGDELHPAQRAGSRHVRGDLGVHRACPC